MKTSDFDYELPAELIAQTPVEPRHAARLLVLDRQQETLVHSCFEQIGEFLHPGDLLVLNETRVIPARLYGRKAATGGRVEVLLIRSHDPFTWEALVGGKGVRPGVRLTFEGGVTAEVLQVLEGALRLIRFSEQALQFLPLLGHVPLPPYIHVPLSDPERYQTVYAQTPGSAAAPTAGLHFTPELMQRLERAGVKFARVTLHVGLDTFAPVNEEDPTQHRIHTEWCQLSPQTAEAINEAAQAGGRIVAVGTTSVRTLETAARHALPGKRVGAFEGQTDLFILPGFKFRAVDALITNFHLPRSTLLMLVSAFAGRERILQAYRVAVEQRYRFYSFGDAMLIV